MTPSVAPTVGRVDARHRYETLVGDTSAGFTAYRDRDARRVFHHTEIGDEFDGITDPVTPEVLAWLEGEPSHSTRQAR
ncbi:GNAT family N-acetyltransferase [Streptomyces sp. NPDC018584]|uniref:GNAT family N-acetyltransferase n=1 Tax=unclassified Streptomyces TaxID=2593676 RepID=UPI0037AEFD69